MADQTIHRAILYFAPDNGAAAKDMAGRMRVEGAPDGGKVEVTLVWSTQFRGDADAYDVGAIIVQDDAPNAEKIIDAYTRLCPSTEIHMMQKDGEWSDDVDSNQEAPTEEESAISAEADTPDTADADAESEDVDTAGSTVASGDGDVLDAGDDAAGSDEEGDSREA